MNESIAGPFKLTPWDLQCAVTPAAVLDLWFCLWPEPQCVTQVVDSPQVPQDRPIKDVIVQALVGEPFAGRTTTLQVSAKSFHWIGPVAPHRSPALDAVCEVKECVYGECADRKSLWVALIINSCAHQYVLKICFKILGQEQDVPAVLVNPIDKPRPDCVHISGGNITPQTKAKEVDEIGEVVVAFWVFEGTP